MNIRIDSVHIFWGPKYSDSSNISVSIEGLGGMDVRDVIPQHLIDLLHDAAVKAAVEKLELLVKEHNEETLMISNVPSEEKNERFSSLEVSNDTEG